MAYEKIEPHGRLTIAAAEFAWDFFMKASTLNADQNGNSVISPLLIQYHMVFLTLAGSGETRKQLLKVMHLKEGENVDDLMRWMLWCMDYYIREVALSYGTKPRSALVINRKAPLLYKEEMLQWVNNYRIRKSYHVVPQLMGKEKMISSIIRRLTGAYPKDFMIEDIFPPRSFIESTRAIIASALYMQLFLPSCGCVYEVSEHSVPFWRVPANVDEAMHGEERLQKVHAMKLVMKVEHLEDEDLEMVGIDLYPANLAVYFLLPKDVVENGVLLNVNQALFALQKKLSGQKLHEYMQQLLPQRTLRTTEIMITLPCFLIRTTSDCVQTMRNLSLDCLFDSKNKDWTNLFEDFDREGENFHLSNVNQDICIQLNITSIASTSFLTQNPKTKPFPANYSGRQLTLNRPFLFFIYDHFSRAFLVFGRCQNPCFRRSYE